MTTMLWTCSAVAMSIAWMPHERCIEPEEKAHTLSMHITITVPSRSDKSRLRSLQQGSEVRVLQHHRITADSENAMANSGACVAPISYFVQLNCTWTSLILRFHNVYLLYPVESPCCITLIVQLNIVMHNSSKVIKLTLISNNNFCFWLSKKNYFVVFTESVCMYYHQFTKKVYLYIWADKQKDKCIDRAKTARIRWE